MVAILYFVSGMGFHTKLTKKAKIEINKINKKKNNLHVKKKKNCKFKNTL